MKCQKCGSDQVRRTTRQGLKEGLLFRLVNLAPFRCQACNWRFIGSFPARKYCRTGERRTVATYLGLGPKELKKLRQLLISLVMIIVLILVIVTLFKVIPGTTSDSGVKDPDRIYYRR